jgi:hypothetical protein
MKVYPVADAYVRSDFKSYKAGGIHYFIIGRFSGTGYGYIKFDIPAISGIVTSAKLNIYEYAFWFWESPPGASRLWAVDVPFNIHKVTGSWSEYGINWNNKPGFDGTLATIINSQDSYELVQGYMVDKTPTADWMVADLPVSLIEEWGTGSNNGLVIERTGPAAWSFTYAKEYWVSNLRPFLEISYNVPTSTQACCGDDSSENHVTSTGYGSDSTSACCTHDTDCVLSSKCYSDGDVTGSLRCEGGSWEDSCIDNDGDGYGDPGNKDCAKGIETDCNDGDANINPGINENTGDLCSDGIDNNCNQDNNVAWDDVSTTGVDCKDLGCAGKTGLANVCCQSVTDCSSVVEGNCGAKSCSSNECIVTVDSDTSTRCSGLTVEWCGISAGTCSVSGDGFSCDMTGDDDKCTCDHYCGGAPSYGCVSLSNNCDSIIYSVCNDPDLAPADKALCVCYGHYSPSSGCDTDYPNTGSTSVGGGIC